MDESGREGDHSKPGDGSGDGSKESQSTPSNETESDKNRQSRSDNRTDDIDRSEPGSEDENELVASDVEDLESTRRLTLLKNYQLRKRRKRSRLA